jgi:GntR family transcriptional regulator, arabinose operon transcriptional repressor
MKRGLTKSTGANAESTVVASVENRKPRHREVFDTLLGEIASGRFRPGDRLPTEAELAKTFSASRNTVARAMRDLKGKGLLHRYRGGGTRIARQDGHRIALFTPFAQVASDLGFIGGQIHTHLSDLASKRGDDLRLQFVRSNHDNLLDEMMGAVDELIERGVSGVFYYPVELPQETAHYNALVVEKIRAAGLALVLVDRDIVAYPHRSTLPLVTYDNRRGGYMLTDHLIRRGCKRIVFVGIPFVSSAVSERMRGYFDALEDNGLPRDRLMIRKANLGDLDAAFCKSIIDELKPDGIICKMDHYAALVGRHLAEMGLKVGQDVKLAGFDDQPIAEMMHVPLTTVRFPVEPFSLVCYERMLRQVADPTAEDPGLTLIDAELVVRASTGIDVQSQDTRAPLLGESIPAGITS